ncbi:MAG: aromatic ring-hydroxylating dioxygenase subunit alpha, partial [Candidatus Neomarinimicrobiota bacterium]|nr:aromatic ring-hydroxylating dioxygenase subunit alpha [Candidatus Neomarinimicrobiota bacterium]
MSPQFKIHKDISKAETLPSSFYKDEDVFNQVKEKIFLKSWQWLGDNSALKLTNSVQPLTLLDGFLTEPILLTRDKEGSINCMTNVCTHRAHILALGPGKSKNITCAYHGRSFDLKGNFKSMPEFKEAKDFPRECDNLYKFPLAEWGPFLFAGLNPAFDFKEVLNPINERVGFLPLEQFSFDSSLSKDYLVQAHWALYCDNYLEGFHIPFVHEGLNKVLDYGSYTTELHKYSNLQIG